MKENTLFAIISIGTVFVLTALIYANSAKEQSKQEHILKCVMSGRTPQECTHLFVDEKVECR